jgi:hypothetical protein
MKIILKIISSIFCNCGFTSFRIILSANQLKTGNTIPIDIPELAAPGAGYAWSIVMAELKYTYGAAPFTSATAFLITDTASIEQMVSGVVLNAQTNSFSKFISTGSSDTAIAENKKVTIVTNADSNVGDGACIIYGIARKIQL